MKKRAVFHGEKYLEEVDDEKENEEDSDVYLFN